MQQRASGQRTAPEISATITETQGNLLIAVAAGAVHEQQAYAVADSLGNTWKAGPARFLSGSQIQFFYAEDIKGGTNQVTLKQPGAFSGSLFLLEYSGVAATDSADVSTGAVASAVSRPATGSMTTTSDCSDVVVAAFGNHPVGCWNWTADAGWTIRAWDVCANAAVVDNLESGGTPPRSTVGASALEDSGESDRWVAAQMALRARGSTARPAPTQLAFTSPGQTILRTWECTSATVQARDGSGQPAPVSTPITAGLSGADLVCYADPACTRPIASTQIPAGTTSQTFYFVGTKTGDHDLVASSQGLAQARQTETIGAPAAFTWRGGVGCDGTFTTGACWQGGAAPGPTDVAHFDASCATNCSVTSLGASSVTIGGLALHPGYSGSVSLGAGMLNAVFVSQEAGTLDTGTSGLTTTAGDLTINGGAFTAGSAPVTIAGSLNIGGGTVALGNTTTVAQGLTVTAGSVDASGSTLVLSDVDCSDDHWILAPGTAVYGNVSILDAPTCTPVERVMPTGSVMAISGNLTLGARNYSSWLSGGTLAVAGDVTVRYLGYTGTTIVRLAGVTNQLLDASSTTAGLLPSLSVASTGGTVTFKGNPIVRGSFVWASGAADFTTNDTTLRFNDAPCTNGESWTLDPGTITYNNVAFVDAPDCGAPRRTLPPASTMTISGNLLLASQNRVATIDGGTLAVAGNVVINAPGYSGTTRLALTGASAATLGVQSGAAVPLGDVTVSKAGSTLTLTSDVELAHAGQSLALTTGTILLDGHSLSVGSSLSVSPGATISEGAGCSLVAGPLVCACTSGCGSGIPATLPQNTGLGCGAAGLLNNGTITCP